MFVKEKNSKFKYLFHYTKKENLEKILQEKEIKTFKDEYTFFTTSYEDSCKLFRELMMKEISYIDDNCIVQKRKMQDSKEYAILKIKIKDEKEFYRFVYNAEGFNPYNYSILHKGNLKFDMAETLDIDNYDLLEKKIVKENYFSNHWNIIRKVGITASISMLLLFGKINVVDATTWEESNSYSTSWYNPTNTSFNISSASELAGLVHLINKENVSFEGKQINIMSDIDATAYSWEQISSNFKGIVEGAHRIYVALEKNDSFISAQSTANISQLSIINNYAIDTDISLNATIEPNGRIIVQENQNKNIKITANKECEITEVIIDNVKQVISNNLEFSYNFENITEPHNIVVKARKKYTHIKNMQNSILNTSVKEQVINYVEENPFDSSYTDIIDGVTYLYKYKDCVITNNTYVWNYEASIVKQEESIVKQEESIKAESEVSSEKIKDESVKIEKDITPKTGNRTNLLNIALIIGNLVFLNSLIKYLKKKK